MKGMSSTKPVISDSHNHLHFSAFADDLPAVIERARDCGVSNMLMVGIDPDDTRAALDTARVYNGVYSSVGIHPQNAVKYNRNDLYDLAGMLGEDKVVAIGETGFDLYRSPDDIEEQRDLFMAHIEIAKEKALPVIIHDRQAHEETLKVMDDMDGWSSGGVFHCFSGDVALAEYVVKKGFFISIPGVVTFKNAGVLSDVVFRTPTENLLVETDAPFLSPVPFRGKRNEPAYLVHTLERMAEIKGMELDEIADITSDNFLRLINFSNDNAA